MDPRPAAQVPPPGAVVVNVAAASATVARAATASTTVTRAATASTTVARAAPAKRNKRRARAGVAMALFVLGCAAASLALFAMAFPPPVSGVQLGRCARTEEEAADLREASELLLMAASAQMLAATATMLEPVAPLAVLALVTGGITANTASGVVWNLVACNGHVHGVFAFYFWSFYVLLLGTFLVGSSVVFG